MLARLDLRRILLFLTFAFGLAWLAGLVIYLTGGLTGPYTGLLLSLPYMWAPAIAHLLTRAITREGWRDTGVYPLWRGWRYWLAAWVTPGLMTIAGLVVYFLIFPGDYDPALTPLRTLLAKAGQPATVDPWTIAIVQVLQAFLIAPPINAFFTFGEEFGWRAYLQPKLWPLGPRRAMLVMGVIWGAWHWPVILMGYNYGLDYPGAPWLGLLAMVWFTFTVGVFLGWVAWRGGSVWPAVIGHGAVNGISALGVIFVQGHPNTLLGPLPVGIIAGLPWAALALAILLIPAAWRPAAAPVPLPASNAEPTPAPALSVTPVPPAPAEDLDDARFIS